MPSIAQTDGGFIEYHDVTMVTDSGLSSIWLYPIVLILPLAAFACRKIYDKTKNPYIGGIIMGLIACILSITNTLTIC